MMNFVKRYSIVRWSYGQYTGLRRRLTEAEEQDEGILRHEQSFFTE